MKKSMSAFVTGLSTTAKIFIACFLFFLVTKIIKKA